MKYFSNFPIINYANNAVRNIFAKVKFDKKMEEYTNSYYPYQLQEGERPDVISHAYYDDAFNDWLVYYANKVVDPYFDYYLDQGNFNKYIDAKYGSISNAQSQVYGYRNNWSEDESIITAAAYASLATNLKKFWAPVVGYSGSITGYERSKSDTYLSTNKIDGLTITITSNTEFSVNQKVTQFNGATPVANAYITFANTSTLVVQHLDGGFQANASYVLSSSTANATVTSVTTIKQNFENNEALYYSSYSYHDYENELNEQKRSINLLDNRYTATVERQFRQLMNK